MLTIISGTFSEDCATDAQAGFCRFHELYGIPLLSLLELLQPQITHKNIAQTFNPFPTFQFTGTLRPVYPLSPKNPVPSSIQHPDYAVDGVPRSEQKIYGRHNIKILNQKEIDGMRKVCRLSREVLDIAAREIRPGVTTDHIDKVVHQACLEREVSSNTSLRSIFSLSNLFQAYPSPLNYVNFPKSVCTSVNEVICHGIPDQRPLEDGDIVNIDISLYHGGFHGDLNETYYVGDKAMADPDAVRVVETSRECLDKAIEIVKPGTLFREFGNVIEKHAKSRDCSVVRSYCGHGINQLFHTTPSIPHYAKSKTVGSAKAGMCFTIEPMINLGSYRDKTWPDNWTSVTADGKRSAQFEHTLLVTEDGVDILTARLPDSPGGPIPMPATAS
ncbi:Methionine aminopeptidase 1 [Microsporum audouinii]